MSEELAYSRPSALAAQLLGDPAAGQFLAKRVLLTADRDALQTTAGRSCFLAAASLLTRVCADLSILLPEDSGNFAFDVQVHMSLIHYAGSINFVLRQKSRIEEFSAILNIGQTTTPSLPWTSIACDGWAIQVSSTGAPIILGFRGFNPAAALAAASLGVAEVFKRLLGIAPARAPMMDGVVFSLLTFKIDADPGPVIKGPIRLDCVLAGWGAIGNGIRHVLLQLPLEGWIAIVDRQHAGAENWGTYIDLTPLDFEKPKAEIAARGWSPTVSARPFSMDIEKFLRKVGSEIQAPDVVLSALDSIDGRHEVQQLWPDVVIDGAIGAFSCQVSRHPWDGDVACLRCLFRHPPGEDAYLAASRATGLTVESVRAALENISDSDIENAPADKKQLLCDNRGRPRCSVIPEAIARELSASSGRFSPSAPFVACFSGAMVAAEFMKYRLGLPSSLDPRFQLDMLRGPTSGLMFEQGRRLECACIARRRTNEKWRRIVSVVK